MLNLRLSFKKSLAVTIAAIACFFVLLKSRPHWLYSTTTGMDWSPAAFDSRSADPDMARPYEKTVGPLVLDELNAVISFKASAYVIKGYPNTFQTSGVNNGLRMELMPGGESGNIGLVYGKKENNFSGITLVPKVEFGRPYSFIIKYNAARHFLSVSVDGKVVERVDAAASPLFDSVVVGRGFDATRPFDGRIWDFHAVITSSHYSHSAAMVNLLLLFICAFAILYGLICCISHLWVLPYFKVWLGQLGFACVLVLLLVGIKLVAPSFHYYYNIVPRLQLSDMRGFDVVTDVVGAPGNAVSIFDKAFDGEVFHSALNVTTGTVRVSLPYKRRLARLGISPQMNLLDRTPKDFTIDGSNDGESWTTLTSVKDADFTGLEAGVFKYFPVPLDKPWKYYRLNVSANNGGQYLTFSELQLDSVKDARWLLALIFLYGTVIAVCLFKYKRLTKFDGHVSRMDIVSVSVLAAFTVLFFIPLRAYLFSASEFGVGLFQVVTALAAVSGLVSALLYLILHMLTDRMRVFAMAFALVVSLLIWVQACVIGWHGGLLDGSVVDWGFYHPEIVHDIFLWACAMTCLLTVPGRICAVARNVSIAAMLVQLASLPAAWTASNPAFANGNGGYGQRNMMRFSGHGENIVLVVLDMYQSNVFGELVNRHDPLLGKLDGFTYFRNALANYPVTTGSISAVLTGDVYDNSMGHLLYLKKIFRERSLFKSAAEAGFAVSALPWIYNELYFAPEFDRTVGAADFDAREYLLDFARLGDIALFLELPYGLRKRVYCDGQWRLYRLTHKALVRHAGTGFPVPDNTKGRDVEFVNKFLSEADTSSEIPTLKFYHLAGNHVPLDTNENLQVESMDFNMFNSVRQGKAALKLASALLERLKQMGVYDNSLIIILGDHGSGVDIPSPRGGKSLSGWTARGVPLLLVKPPRSSGALKTSEAPVMLSDIPATVQAFSGIKGNFPGINVFALDPNKPRPRRFVNSATGYFLNDKFESLQYYDVSGHSWDSASWKPVKQ